MRHQHMAGVTAVRIDAEVARGGAIILLAMPAGGALAAADPWIDRDLVARPGVRPGVGTGARDGAGDLVAKGEGQGAALRDVELLVAAEPEVAVLDMQVGMAHAAALDPHQHLTAARLRAIGNGLAQGRPIGGERLAHELGHGSRWGSRSVTARARAAKPATGISSARAVSAMPAPASSVRGSGVSDLRLWRSIFRRWPKAASVTRSRVRRSHGAGADRGTRRTTAEVTLGGGTKAEAETSNRIFTSARQPASTESRP